MSVLFNQAIRHDFLPQGTNPITMVGRTGSGCGRRTFWRSMSWSLCLTSSRIMTAMALLHMVTGLRRSELFGLEWMDVYFEQRELSVTRSAYRQRVGRCKTEISRKPKVKMTLEFYAQAVTPGQTEAQSKVAGLLGRGIK
jgi:integrase